MQGLSYKISCRKPIKADERLPLKDAAEEVLLDENAVAKGKKHCDISGTRPSVDHEMLAYCADFSGYYSLFENTTFNHDIQVMKSMTYL